MNNLFSDIGQSDHEKRPSAGSSYWLPAQEGDLSRAQPMRQRVEFGKTQVVRTGREGEQREGSHANKMLHNSEFGAE